MFGGRAARAHTRTHARAQPISLPFLPPDSRFPMTDLHYLVPNRGFEEGSLQSLAYMAVARARGCNATGWNNVPYIEVYTSHMQAPPGPFPPAGQARAHARAHAPMRPRVCCAERRRRPKEEEAEDEAEGRGQDRSAP